MSYIEDLRIFIRRIQPRNLRLENDLMLMRENMQALSKEVPFMITESLKKAMNQEPGYDATLSHYTLTIYTPITTIPLWVANGEGFLKVEDHHWLSLDNVDKKSLFSDIENILGVSLPYTTPNEHEAISVLEL